ncbi:MAG: serine O-acetyltransferase EpsC [Myxococcota bacterium]
MTTEMRENPLARAIASLSKRADAALSKAAEGGLPDPAQVVDWVTRMKRLVLVVRDREVLAAELPELVEALHVLMRGVAIREGGARERVVEQFLDRLPGIRSLLSADVEAAFEGDPSAKSYAEIVVSYPSIRAIATYRIAHELHALGVPLLPRMMTEYAHDRTGIDIHPGATIGRRFFIDHGTGVVIGETSEIGDNVRIYQGVTLGAKSPRHGETLSGVKRHPTIEDDVTIYAGATILGGETTIGQGTVIGGNVWIVESVAPDSKVIAEPPTHLVRRRRNGDHRQLQWDI